MKDELSKFRAEVKADFELTWARITEQGGHLEERCDKLEASVDGLAEAVSQVQIDVKELSATLKETTRVYQGRMRQMEERFDTVLGLVQDEYASQSDVDALEKRVAALEKKQPPAA